AEKPTLIAGALAGLHALLAGHPGVLPAARAARHPGAYTPAELVTYIVRALGFATRGGRARSAMAVAGGGYALLAAAAPALLPELAPH
ncbi:hypothetical protein OFC56_34255, partial [Escherichia coli]|nr:hypothetical protein [Escherichia coli]